MAQSDVQAVKDQLTAQGKDLSGSCGAFEITKRVAWNLRAQGLGLLRKTSGNNCGGFSVDGVMKKDGSAWDILGDGGGANNPQWNAIDPVDPALWTAPTDPQDTTIPAPPAPTPTPAPPPVDLGPVLAQFEALNANIKALSDAHERQYQDLVARLNEIKAIASQTAPKTYVGSVFGVKFTLTAQ